MNLSRLCVLMAEINYSSYSFQPIAFVRTSARYRYEEPRQPVFSPTPAQIEFLPDAKFRDALSDLEGFQRIWVIAVFHLNLNPDRTSNWNPKVRPPVTPDNRKYGVFSTRSPHRPNPIAISCVEVDKIEGSVIYLKTCDLLDGTPVLDVKPYIPEVDAFPNVRAGWRDQLRNEYWDIVFEEKMIAKADFLQKNGAPDMLSFCRIQLKLSPIDKTRKRITEYGGDLYSIGCRTWRILFTVQAQTKQVTVKDVFSNYLPEELVEGTDDPYNDKELHRRFIAMFGSQQTKVES